MAKPKCLLVFVWNIYVISVDFGKSRVVLVHFGQLVSGHFNYVLFISFPIFGIIHTSSIVLAFLHTQ